jgi:hypothetical protein
MNLVVQMVNWRCIPKVNNLSVIFNVFSTGSLTTISFQTNLLQISSLRKEKVWSDIRRHFKLKSIHKCLSFTRYFTFKDELHLHFAFLHILIIYWNTSRMYLNSRCGISMFSFILSTSYVHENGAVKELVRFKLSHGRWITSWGTRVGKQTFFLSVKNFIKIGERDGGTMYATSPSLASVN